MRKRSDNEKDAAAAAAKKRPQAEARSPCAPVACLYAFEAVEYPLLLASRDAYAIVAHAEAEAAFAGLPGSQVDADFLAGVFDGVVYQVGKHLAQAESIGMGNCLGGAVNVEDDRFGGFEPELGGQLLEERAQRHGSAVQLQFTPVYLRQCYYTGREGKQVVALVTHGRTDAGGFFGLVVQLAACHDLRAHQDGLQGRLHVVYHRVGEILAELFQPALAPPYKPVACGAQQAECERQCQGQEEIPGRAEDVALRRGNDALHAHCSLLIQAKRCSDETALVGSGAACLFQYFAGVRAQDVDAARQVQARLHQFMAEQRVQAECVERYGDRAFVDYLLGAIGSVEADAFFQVHGLVQHVHFLPGAMEAGFVERIALLVGCFPVE